MRRRSNGSLLLLAALATGCADVYVARPSAPADERVAVSALYVLGDFGTPNLGFHAVARAIAADVAADERQGRVERAPLMLELGDNMYIAGLPRPGANVGRERERLRKMGAALGACRYRGQPVPLVLIPGNHDYDERALDVERSDGDITRWFFLEDFGVAELEAWRPVPGQLDPGDESASQLYARIYQSPAALADFMAPRLVPGTPAELGIVAIDSELLLALIDAGHELLVDRYLEALRRELRKIPAGSFRAVAAHHPLETYGNRPGQLGRFALGPGWPQFPEWWQKLLAVPPFAQLAAVARWLVHHDQDIHSGRAETYRERVHRVLVDEDVDLFFSGHDHNHQLIDLGEVFGEGHVLQVLTGSGAKVDHPVTDGAGTIVYRLGHGYVRLLVYPDRLLLELKDADGRTVYRHAVG